MALLSLENVVKRYDRLVAVDHVSFQAQPGRILGLLGPNGAGKTSTIRMITNITAPDEGQILFDGRPVGRWSQDRMGYLPEERGLYKRLKVGEQLIYLAELKGLSKQEAREGVQAWLTRFDALDWFGRKTDELSKGMQQKVQFITTVLHNPSLLILDEPFGGLDPINAELLRDVIWELRDEGRCILFASHRMEQVEQLCDDICLISKGRIVLKGALRDVKRQFGKNTVIVEFEGDPGFADELQARGIVKVMSRSHNRVEMKLLDGTSSRSVLDHAVSRVAEIYRYELVEPPLSEIFVQVVRSQQ
ncbi:MAG: ATP-binding cassette domain-containing protein [Rhodothermales bacterium]